MGDNVTNKNVFNAGSNSQNPFTNVGGTMNNTNVTGIKNDYTNSPSSTSKGMWQETILFKY